MLGVKTSRKPCACQLDDLLSICLDPLVQWIVTVTGPTFESVPINRNHVEPSRGCVTK